MELSNSFEVARSVEEAWLVLTDLERIAPCLPGAKLEEIKGDEYLGIVKVKVGPITSQYKGVATFVERDDANHKAVLKADGRDTKGAGNASATITATLESVSPTRTSVDVSTDLMITGKVAQFGRGIMADVSAKLMTQFAENLGTMLESAPAADDVLAETGDTGSEHGGPEGTADSVDLLDLAGASVLKRLVPSLIVVVAVVVILILVLDL